MKAYEIINTAFGLAGEILDDYPAKNLAVIWLNFSIAESIDAENILRSKKGLGEIKEYPAVSDISDVVNMDDKICRVCLPLGVVSYLFSDRENDYLYSEYRSRFIRSLQSVAGGIEISVTDFYRGGYGDTE